MAETLLGIPGNVIIADLFDDFRRLAELNAFMEDHNGATEPQRDELAASLGAKIVGNNVHVTELSLAKESDERAIESWSIVNTLQIESLARRVGTYDGNRRLNPATGKEYVAHEFFRYRRHSHGKVEAVDGPNTSLVVRPRSPMSVFDRHWIRVVNAGGEPLVSMTIADNR